jgi:hypothetical protein
MRCDILTALKIPIVVLRAVTPCGLVGRRRCSFETVACVRKSTRNYKLEDQHWQTNSSYLNGAISALSVSE